MRTFLFYVMLIALVPVAVVERSEAWTVFDHPEAVIAGSNLVIGMDVECVSAFFCV
jgi:hypothetical protein